MPAGVGKGVQAGLDQGRIALDYKLCLNRCVVLVEKKHMFLLDPLSLGERYCLNIPESADVDLVCFKATGDKWWLIDALVLPGAVGANGKSRWWASNSVRVPLIQEVKAQIKTLKQKKRANEPRDPLALILLEVRGMLLWVRNSSMSVMVGLIKEPGWIGGPGPDHGNLLWFCKELQKDILENLDDKATKRDPGGDVPAEYKEQVEEVLDVLKAHPQCQQVHFLPSSKSFRIRKRSGASKLIYVVGLNKFLKSQASSSGSSQPAQDPWHQCLSKALSYLDGVPDDPPNHAGTGDGHAGPAGSADDAHVVPSPPGSPESFDC